MVMLVLCMTVAADMAGDRQVNAVSEFTDTGLDVSGVSNRSTTSFAEETYYVVKSLSGNDFTGQSLSYTRVIVDCAEIPAGAFSKSTIKELVLTDTVETICEGAFTDCTSLASISKVGNTDIVIEAGAFTGCTGLKLIDARTYGEIRDGAFPDDCSAYVLVDDSRIPEISTGGTVMMEVLGSDVSFIGWETNYVRVVYIGYGALKGTFEDGTDTSQSSSVKTYGEIYRFNVSSGMSVTIDYRTASVSYGGVFGLEDEVLVMDQFEVDLATPPEGAIGVTFYGWNTDSGAGLGTSLSRSELAALSYGPLTLVPSIGSFTVTFAFSELPESETVPTMSSQNSTYGSTYPTCKSTEHYNFAGWSVEGYDEPFQAGDTIVLYAAHTATAVWEPKSHSAYCVTYLNVDGTVAGTSETVGYGQAVTIGDIAPADETATQMLDGWSDGSSSDLLRSGDSVVLEDDLSLTPVLRDRAAYDIRFLDGETLLHESTAYEGLDFAIDAEDPSSDGKSFSGWELAGHDGLLKAGDTISVTADADLTASWSEIVYRTVKYVSDGTTVSQTQVADGTEVTVAAAVEKDGYTFKGWSDGVNTHDAGSSVTISADTVFSAVWERLPTYTVTFHLADGTTKAVSDTSGEEVTALSSAGTKDGYSLSGWSTTSTGSVEYAAGSSIVLTKSIDLYPVWTKLATYTLTFHLADGTTSEVSGTAGKEVTVLSSAGTKDGYALSGWSTTATGTVEYAIGSKIVLSKSMDLYPVWEEPTRYTVTFHLADGTTTTASGTTGEEVAVPSSAGTKDGYELSGWSMSSTGSVEYAVGSTVVLSKNLDLYPVWKAVENEEQTPEDDDDGDGDTESGNSGWITLDDFSNRLSNLSDTEKAITMGAVAATIVALMLAVLRRS